MAKTIADLEIYAKKKELNTMHLKMGTKEKEESIISIMSIISIHK